MKIYEERIFLTGAGLCFRKDRKVWIGAFSWAVFFWGIAWVVQAEIGQRLNGEISPMQMQSSFSSGYSDSVRRELLIYPFRLWMQHPIFGTGLGVFFATSTQWFTEPIVIHCTPLWILTEFGIVGLGFFIWVFASVLHYGWAHRRQPQNRALLALLFAFAVFGLAHEVFYQRIFWFALGALLAQPFSLSHKERRGA